ncbi:uncharacterized protein NPIL_567231 [Nephila pilipes]|uniref:Uncharacterized protein n=1 Tax=Nephila pilipes TaxID=299642 RepID=A0A8X6P2E4_NEPPI|nr:uncharacterized protein NPIL_567231 [Nephila pilipes]
MHKIDNECYICDGFGSYMEGSRQWLKSMKFHMKRVIDPCSKRVSRSLAEIEAVLNSRPLVAASDDPNYFSVITPCHLLIGLELKSIPEPDYTSEKISVQKR